MCKAPWTTDLRQWSIRHSELGWVFLELQSSHLNFIRFSFCFCHLFYFLLFLLFYLKNWIFYISMFWNFYCFYPCSEMFRNVRDVSCSWFYWRPVPLCIHKEQRHYQRYLINTFCKIVIYITTILDQKRIYTWNIIEKLWKILAEGQRYQNMEWSALYLLLFIGVQVSSEMGGRWPSCPKKIRSARMQKIKRKERKEKETKKTNKRTEQNNN